MANAHNANAKLFEGFILAGGASSRMGRAKHLLDLGGSQLISRTIRIVEPLVSQVTVVGAAGSLSTAGMRVISDENFGIKEEHGKSKSPLVGIATALLHSQTTWNLILACDLPYLRTDWLEWFLKRAAESEKEAVVPQTSRGLEPLAASYRRDCGPILERLLRDGVRKVTEALKSLSTEIVDESEWREIDPEGLVLKNMNTPEDYEQARARLIEKVSHA